MRWLERSANEQVFGERWVGVFLVVKAKLRPRVQLSNSSLLVFDHDTGSGSNASQSKCPRSREDEARVLDGIHVHEHPKRRPYEVQANWEDSAQFLIHAFPAIKLR